MNQENTIQVIKNTEYLQELVDSGFKVIGPRQDEQKDFQVNCLIAFMNKNKVKYHDFSNKNKI